MRKKHGLWLLAAAALAVSLAGCSGSEGAEGGADGAEQKEMTEYSTVYTAEVSTLNYLETTNSDSIALFYNIMDGLVEFDRFGEMIPCIAEKWEISDDELTYTFHLRDDVKWYDWEGNEMGQVKAQDFVDGIRWILNKDNAASTSKTVYDVVKNAEAYYNGEITDFNEVGVKAIDDLTVEYTLEQPTPYFLKQLSFPCFFR